MIQVICTHCGLRILVPPTVQGKHGVCFNCGQGLDVPSNTEIKKHLDLAYEPGDRVTDRYVIEEHVGRGGMGVVYRARDTLVNETVALKFLHPKLLRTDKGQQLFIQEAQIARRLRHENIVAVHDVSWTAEGILFLSMEFADGQPLRQFLRKQRQDRKFLDVRLAVTITSQLLRAFEFAHRYVVHRDMKPENVMFLPGEKVKILDFGLAKAVQEEFIATGASLPEREKVIGTLAYASPEQKKMQAVDLRADLYAVGLIFHELLTLRTPLDEPVSAEKVRPDASPSLIAVLKKATAEDREQRWASAKEFRRALEAAFNESYRRRASVPVVKMASGKPVSTEGMVFFDGGSFLMGNEDQIDEAPEAEVFVRPFWMDIHPVTVSQYKKFIKETGHPEPKFFRDPMFNGPMQPVIGVSWEDAMAYAAWAGKQLPTEAQWEFAARGRENRRYPWGNLPPASTLANFKEFLGMTSIVTMHDEGATPEGIYDMAGNVFEWTRDPFLPYPKQRNDREAAESAPRRTVRGGCWKSPAEELTTTFRRGFFPESQLNIIGFRCVISEA